MQEILKLGIGLLFLLGGIPLGNFLAKITKEELGDYKLEFKIIVWVGIVGGFTGLIISDDVLMFSLFFIAIVTSRSLVKKMPRAKKQV